MARASQENAAVDETAVNDVRLVGRLAGPARVIALPSGDDLHTFRIVVARTPSAHSKQKVDALECAVWAPGVARRVLRWGTGDVVEVTGAVRRRFYKTPVGAASRVEIEVAKARRITRAPVA